MRLATVSTAAGPRLGVVLDHELLVVGAHAEVPNDMMALLRGGPGALASLREVVATDPATLPRLRLDTAKLLAPIPRPPKNVFAVGRNYPAHVQESVEFRGVRAATDEWPAFFTKAPTTVIGPGASIPYDGHLSQQWDWEVELAVVIGRIGRDIPRERAYEYVFGYTVINDISVRDVQNRHGGQLFRGKSIDGTCPMGPWIVTVDEIRDPQQLALTLRVNGAIKQAARTDQMVFPVAVIIEHLSAGLTLEPGDVIATGTPAGVGFVRQPPEFLTPGDIVEAEIERIGVLPNPVVDRWS